ncbi:MAG: hypothetical protein ACREMQ_09835 [Longimicrobiales bacterium]
MMKSRIAGIAAATFFLACGDSTGVEFAFPEVTGTYDYTATVTGVPELSITGTLSITDDSRDTDAFTGSFTIRLSGGGITPVTLNGSIASARVTETGNILFDFELPEYRHQGTISGRTISGTYVLIGTTSSFNGNFTAIRR